MKTMAPGKTLLEMVHEEQLRHASEAARRFRVARQRLIGAVLWFGISLLIPSIGWFAWLVIVAMGTAALWNAEQGVIERRLSFEPLRPDDLE